jgi:stage II sporulation SpoAA-like protein
MDRIQTVTHKGKQIVVVDYGGLTATEYPAVMRRAMAFIAGLGKGEVLTATVVAGTRFGVGTTDDVKAYSAHIRPYVKASAVVGLSGLQKVIFATVRPFLSQNLQAFDDLEKAKEWLASQG